MTLHIPADLLAQIQAHGEAAYPEEGAGFLLGQVENEDRVGVSILSFANAREDGSRHNRYLIGPREVRQAEDAAEQQKLTWLGVFHSHPDHPSQPSETDLKLAMPWLSYLITRVDKGKAIETRSWRLNEDRSQFSEEKIEKNK